MKKNIMVESFEQEILKKIRAKDEKTLIELRREYLPMIKYMVLNYTYSDGKNAIYGNQSDVEDIMHDAFYIIIKKIFDGNLVLTSKLKTYFYSVSKNLLKLKLHRRFLENRIQYFSKNEINDSNNTDRLYDTNLKNITFNNYYNKISPVCKRILSLYWLEYSVTEISEILGNTKKYIMKRKHECQKKLIKLIKNSTDNNVKEKLW